MATTPENTQWQEIDAGLRTRLTVVLALLCLWYYGADLLAKLDLHTALGLLDLELTHWFRLLVTVLVLLALPLVFKSRLASIGISRPKPRDLTTFLSFALLSGGAFALLGLALVGALELFPQWFTRMGIPTGGVLERIRYLAAFPELDAFGVVMTIVALPIMEEIFFRGLLYPHLRREFGAKIAIFATALIFALAHGTNFPISQMIGGIFFAWAFERTGRLWAPIALHILGNGSLYFLTQQMAMP